MYVPSGLRRNRRRRAIATWMAVGLSAMLAVSLFLTTPAHSQSAVTFGGYTTSATVSPTSVSPGATASIAAVISSASASTVLVDVEVYNASWTKVFQQYFDNQTLTAGAPLTLTSSWAVPAGQAPGTYTVMLGIFTVGWGTVLDWNNSAAQFTVGPTTTTTTTTTTATGNTTTTTGNTTTTTGQTTTTAPSTGSSACGLSQVAFCATFPSATENPSNDSRWARWTVRCGGLRW